MNETQLNDLAFVLGDETINGIKLHDSIRDEELHEYEIINREDFIDQLISWIAEANGVNKTLMIDDLKLLINWEDEYILSSNMTNSYLRSMSDGFDEVCKELLSIHKKLIGIKD